LTDDNSYRHKRDPHYIKAKKEGYRARSAYKLLDLHKKFKIFKRAFYILDLGSAPGSWLQVAKEFAEKNLEKYNDTHYYRTPFKIMGVDLKHVTSIEGVKVVKMDFTNPEFKVCIKEFFNNEKLDLILSDASIEKSGNHFSDHIQQIKLCEGVLDIAKQFLKIGGNLVIKLFQGPDMKGFKSDLKKYFKYVKAYKPKASKDKSNEIYIICLKKYDVKTN
jgi:23S rRNA (uridine2552-2'-O)-methyltransferase